MHKTYKKRQPLRKPLKKISKKRHQRGGNTKTMVDDAASIYDASKIHPASLHLDKKFLIKPPQFTTKIISENLYMVLNENRTWTIHKMN